MAISEDDSSTQIYDTSLYMKNHVIGLTQFVQKQVLEQVAQELNVDIEDILDGADSGAVIEDCTVYQLKDGKWLWRPESFA
jgi:energy-converting hydrogenase A subunit M